MLVAVVAVVALVAVALLRDAPQPWAVVGQPAPAFALESLNGGRVDLASLRGRPVILTFFASWCLPCRKELPLFLSAQGRHPGLALVGIVFQDEPAPARVFRNAIGGDWPGLIDPGGAVARTYAVVGIPRTYFIDRDGVVRAIKIGEIDKPALDERLALIDA